MPDAPEHVEDNVKYAVLIYSNPATWEMLSPEEQGSIIGDHNDLMSELTASGEFLNIYRLADPANARTLRRHAGVPAVTDGPFGEAKEVLASVWEIDVEGVDRAIEIAEPLTRNSAVEIRPLMDAAGLEM